MKVQIVSVDPNKPVQFGAEQFGYWGRFRSPEVSGQAILVSMSHDLNGLVEGRTIEANAFLHLLGASESEFLGDSVSEFRLVPSSETPRIECLSEPGDYSVVGTVIDVQSYIQVGDWLFELSENSTSGVTPREGQRVSFKIHRLALVDRTRVATVIKSFGPFSNLIMRDDGVRVVECQDLFDLSGEPAFVLKIISDALRNDDWKPCAIKMLNYPEWRFHLVAGCALLFKPSKRVLPHLWKAIDAGSWVASQLAVVGYFSDAGFVEHAIARVEAGCPVKFPERLNNLEIYSLSVSQDEECQSAKNIATLLYLCGQVPELSSWYKETRESLKVAAHLKRDFAGSAALTDSWLKNITRLFQDRGTTLSPAYQRQF